MPAATLEQIIANARALVQSSQSDKALEILGPLIAGNENNVLLLQVFGEVLLETNDLETAYDILTTACELDPEAAVGTEKFLYLGQIIGGFDGLKYLDTGLSKLDNQLKLIQNGEGEQDPILVDLAKTYSTQHSLISYLIKKLNQGIFAKIEIWMTDLCMEPEAESKCNDLISYSLQLDSENPEALSLLASIRISQQRNDEAKQSLLKSWDLFESKKKKLEESANKLQNAIEESNEQDENDDAFEVGVEYIELIQPFLTLARFAIELELYELAISIASNISDINEDILDSHYYEAFAYILSAKQIYKESNQNKIDEDYRDLDLSIVKSSNDENIKSLIGEAKSSLTQGFKIINSEAGSESDPDLVGQVNELLQELGGPAMADLLPQRRDDAEDEGWEDEIQSGDEN